MTGEQWKILCLFMHAVLKDEGNENFKAELRRQMDLAGEFTPDLNARLGGHA